MNTNETHKISDEEENEGIFTLKLDKISELSWEAEGLLVRMANVPKCDFRTAEELQKMFPADSVETYQNALNELADKKLVILIEGKYAINKTKMFQSMIYLGSKSKDKEEINEISERLEDLLDITEERRSLKQEV